MRALMLGLVLGAGSCATMEPMTEETRQSLFLFGNAVNQANQQYNRDLQNIYGGGSHTTCYQLGYTVQCDTK